MPNGSRLHSKKTVRYPGNKSSFLMSTASSIFGGARAIGVDHRALTDTDTA